MRLRSALPALGLALLVATGTAGAAPIASPLVGHWGSVGSGTPPLFPAGSFPWVVGSSIGPDGRFYAYGGFSDAGGDPTADGVAVFDPALGRWSGLGDDGAGNGALNGQVMAIAWVNGLLYAGGSLDVRGTDTNIPPANLAAWNGTTWTERGPAGALTNAVNALASLNGYLYVAGGFQDAGGDPTADYLASFDGYAWRGVGSNGAGDGALNGGVYALQAMPDGRLFAGGYLTDVGPGGLGDGVAWWDPGTASWNAVGGGAAGDSVFSGLVRTVHVVGSKVYVGGSFIGAAGNAKADYAAVWNGSAWAGLGADAAGTGSAINGDVFDITTYGSNVIVGGDFTDAGGVAAADRVAAWNGSKWMALGSPGPDDQVWGLTASGRTLIAGGTFMTVGGMTDSKALAAFGLPAPPSAPRSLVGLARPQWISLTWKAPASANGGGPLRGYTVQYRKLGTTAWRTFTADVPFTAWSTHIGIKKGVTYQFRVLARNDWGLGASSVVVTVKAR